MSISANIDMGMGASAASINFDGAGVGTVSFGNDANVNVVFYTRPVLDGAKSQAMGRPVHVSAEYVRIQQPGERDTIDRPVQALDKQRWPGKWQQFKANTEQAPNGTQIEFLFPANPEIAVNLHGVGIHTVEQLAHLPDSGADSIGMGATQWREAAKKFLSGAKKGVEFHQLKKELDARDVQLETLQNQLALQKAQIERLMAATQGVPSTMIPAEVPMNTPIAQQALPAAPPEPIAFDAEYEAEMAALNNVTVKPTFGE